jgi:hypothetical protein
MDFYNWTSFSVPRLSASPPQHRLKALAFDVFKSFGLSLFPDNGLNALGFGFLGFGFLFLFLNFFFQDPSTTSVA